MKTIKESARGSKLRMKKSIFFCSAWKATIVDDATAFLELVRKEFPKASHHAYSYRIGNPVTWEDSSDDGEPRGTAGSPIMTILQGMNLTNLAVVVTRFYGGVKLGPGGLIKAYSRCAKDLLDLIGTEELG